MRMPKDWIVLTVRRIDGVWLVEHEGEPFGHSPERAVAEAAARRRARELQETGRPCQVRLLGEGAWALV